MTYTVQSGDSLSSIASKFLGSTSKYMDIYNLNKSVIGSNPNVIKAGQVLTMPAGASSVALASASVPKTSVTTSAAGGGIMDQIKAMTSKITPLLSNKFVIIGAAGAAVLLVLVLTQGKGKKTANPRRRRHHRKGK